MMMFLIRSLSHGKRRLLRSLPDSNKKEKANLKVLFLGTNGWYDTQTGNTICILIRTLDYEIILDAGNSLYKLERYINEGNRKPAYLFLSHFHLDHIIGLHTLIKLNFRHGLNICGPAGTR
jgi:ribonuclease BN (tRNA processing enzyme)